MLVCAVALAAAAPSGARVSDPTGVRIHHAASGGAAEFWTPARLRRAEPLATLPIDATPARVAARWTDQAAASRYSPVVAGLVTVHVLRGWTDADVKVRGTHSFRLVNTHLEAFGDPTIREAQAKELVAPGGPATGDEPVVLIGDLNSDDDTVSGGDRLAYQALQNAGFFERSTADPLGCCLNTSIITDNLGNVSDFDHQVDHVLTNAPNEVGLVTSSVTGRQPVNGYWDSDHAGLVSTLVFDH